MAMNDLDSAIDQSHAALGAILKGDPGVYQSLYSDADVTLGIPVRTLAVAAPWSQL